MDYSHGSVATTTGLGSNSLGFSERSLSGLTSELSENRQRLSMHTMNSPNSTGSLSPNNHMGLKQCRSASEMDLDDRRGGGPLKLARTDSFPCRQSDLKMHMNGSPTGTMGGRSSSVVSDGRLGCSPTNSCASDGALMGNDHGNVVSDARLLRQDSVVSAPAYPGAQSGGRPLSYHHQTPAYHYRPSGAGLSMGRDGMSHMSQSAQNSVSGARAPFTSVQWAELEHQALIFKYMMAGVNVPQELLNPIRKSVNTLNGLTASHHATNLGWGTFHLGVANNTDPEPGRCRRTDGKKWRCGRDVVPDQKYCERHMHRGRHRSRKPVDGQTTSTSQSGAATSSGPASSITAAASRSTTPTSGSSLSHSNLRPSILSGNSQSASALGAKSFSSPSGSGGLSVGSSPATSSHFQLPSLSSPSGTSALTSKDYRYLNGMSKAELGMGPEQMLFSEASGSTRGLSQEAQSFNNLSRLPTVNQSWHSMSTKVPPAPQPKASGNNSLLNYTSPQMRGLLGQDFGLMPETSQVNLTAMTASQQPHSFLSSGYGGVEAVSVGRESEGQPLRHFFDDWPRSRDPSALAWGSDVEESERTSGRGGSNHTSNNTQLSISIPITAPSSDFTSQNSDSPPRGKLSLSPLKLSMSRAGDSSSGVDPLGVEPTDMGLGVGLGGLACDGDDRHRQIPWVPITWESSAVAVGGPLAELLQSSTPRAATPVCTSSGLNLLCDGWHEQQLKSPMHSPSRIASPTGVLQKPCYGTSSDSSPSTSYSGSPHTLPSELVGTDTVLLRSPSPMLVNGACPLA